MSMSLFIKLFVKDSNYKAKHAHIPISRRPTYKRDSVYWPFHCTRWTLAYANSGLVSHWTPCAGMSTTYTCCLEFWARWKRQSRKPMEVFFELCSIMSLSPIFYQSAGMWKATLIRWLETVYKIQHQSSFSKPPTHYHLSIYPSTKAYLTH